ncbi:hypothetical protein FQA39_LY18182 [Lamprigera yunnana]|nr:hypothetical protein FQA39_LY18182 [Lamprigera yunnana]
MPNIKTPKPLKPGRFFTPSREMSDSEESTKSTESETANSCNSEDLSIVAEFDDLMRLCKLLKFDNTHEKFIEFVANAQIINEQLIKVSAECQRLQGESVKMTHEYSDLESKLFHARKLLDQEKKLSRKLEDERSELEEKIALILQKNKARPEALVRDLSLLIGDQFDDEPKGLHPHLSAIQEVNTTGSLISDFSYSRSEDDLDVSAVYYNGKIKAKKRNSDSEVPALPKKRRSINNKSVEINQTDTVRATTTVTVCRDGPITATSVIESLPTEANQKLLNKPQPSAPPAHLVNGLHSEVKSTSDRKHQFQNKTIVIPEVCSSCNKRVRFGRTIFKCKECRAICHPECKDLLPLPCIPLANTPLRGGVGLISDYTPVVPPMVPALIVHCTKEVESRGKNEVGLYRLPGAEKDVKTLKERFLRGKGSPCLTQIDVHVICSTVKDFLRSLYEPLITSSRWYDFMKAIEMPDRNETVSLVSQLIWELPQPNRDTLSYMMLHLKRVSAMPECKMPATNLARVFAPTIIGFSSTDLNRSTLLRETNQQFMVMECLINLSTEYWESFLTNNEVYETPKGTLQQTPSTDSLLYPRSRVLFSPYSFKSATKKKQKRFPTP